MHAKLKAELTARKQREHEREAAEKRQFKKQYKVQSVEDRENKPYAKLPRKSELEKGQANQKALEQKK